MSNRLAFGALTVACMAAAAGGGYLASRQNAVPTPAAAQAPVAQTATSAPAAAPAPVQETEAIVGDRAPKAAPEKPVDKPAEKPAAARRAESPRASAAGSRTPAASTQARKEQPPSPPGLSSTWPSSAAQQSGTPPQPATSPEPGRAEDRNSQEPARPAEPTKPTFEELVIARDSVIGLQTDNRISTETARVEDRVDAHVTRDVKVGDRVAIPAGSRVIGTVTQVERGGKFKEQARLGIRFHTIVLGDGNRLPISTETIVRLGEAPGNGTAAKIGGGAVGGAILGAIFGGAKGAAIGATAGAGAGTAATAAGDRSAVVLPPGTPLTPRILSPVTVTVEHE
jgi:hypothetical protein